jgi:RHS repeat-associated protein
LAAALQRKPDPDARRGYALYFISLNHGTYSLENGQRAVIDAHTNFSGTLIQNGGTLLVQGTFHAEHYHYHGGDITVTGKLHGNNWSSALPQLYEHCDYGGIGITLPEGTYDQASMIALGIPDNWLSSVRVGKGYQVTLYEHPGFTGRVLVLREDQPCLSSDNFNDLNSSIRVERLSGQTTPCSPGVGATQTIGTLTNYGTFQFQHPVFAAGTKLYNYGTLKTGSLSLPSNSEIHNFGNINSTFLEIALGSTTYSHPASRIDADNLEIRGHIVGDAYNYSSLTSTNTTLHTSGSVMGLVKLCTRQQLHANGEIGSMVVQDCSFTIPVLQQRTAHLYRSQQGYKAYELSNHLGNVLTTISDRRIGVAGSNPALIDHYTAVILSSQDYYAFGWEMPGRKYNSTNYRYGFNGKEDDAETGWQDYGMRIYNPQLSRFFSVDPVFKNYPWYTPYQFAGNTPISSIDLDGLEPVNVTKLISEGKPLPVLSPTQWYAYGYGSVVSNDKKTFASAFENNLTNNNHQAYNNIAQRSRWYAHAHLVVNQGHFEYHNFWFEAAEKVTQWWGVGGADGLNLWFMNDEVEGLLRKANVHLLEMNFKNFGPYVLGSGPIQWTNPETGKFETFEHLSGAELDNQMVVIEMTTLQEYLNEYKNNYIQEKGEEKWKDLHDGVNRLFGDRVDYQFLRYMATKMGGDTKASEYAQAEFKKQFNEDFDFMEKKHRIFQGQKMAEYLRDSKNKKSDKNKK